MLSCFSLLFLKISLKLLQIADRLNETLNFCVQILTIGYPGRMFRSTGLQKGD